MNDLKKNEKLPSFNVQQCNLQESVDPQLFKQSRTLNDISTSRLDIHQSMAVGAYNLDNMYGCDCGLEKAREVQLSQPAINFKGGLGWIGEKGCLVDNDNKLRFSEQTNMNYIHQLPNLQTNGFFGKGEQKVDEESNFFHSDLTNLRFINQLPNSQTNGFFGKGNYNVDNETILQSSNITKLDRPCNVLSGVSIENLQPALFPMNDRLKSEVQDPKHIVPEDSMTSWVRGGLPSRQIARNVDYINRCEQNKVSIR